MMMEWVDTNMEGEIKVRREISRMVSKVGCLGMINDPEPTIILFYFAYSS